MGSFVRMPKWMSVVALLAFAAALLAASPPIASAASDGASFVGAETCATCHPAAYTGWKSSQHARAMQHATAETVLGDFAQAKFHQNGVESTFFRRDGKFFVRTDGADGALADFEIKYTFGIFPLQQYLIELPNGRIQALGIAWDARAKDAGGQRWFHLYPDQTPKAGDVLHWTGVDQNWNYQCAYCHSTNLKKNYDPGTARFNTTWSEINVACESCHGPASHHVAWASKQGDWQSHEAANKTFVTRFDERKNVHWTVPDNGKTVRSEARKTAREIEACAACHARRQQFSDDSASFHNAFRPSLLEAGLYHQDGQQRDEVYNYASFLQSRMHAAGVTCSDCHDPHTQKLRAEGNAVCSQCHRAEQYDAAAHHRHAAGSAGAQCVNCHMPTTTYMVVDPRHDHSMRIPRPDVAHLAGAPNACNNCHADKTPAWAADAIKTWYPTPKPGFQTFAAAFDLADRNAPGAEAELLRIATDGAQPAIARASAVARLSRFLSRASLPVVAKALKDDDPSVRAAAVVTISRWPRLDDRRGTVAGISPRLMLLAPLLGDSARDVRMETARALAGQDEAQLSPQDRQLFQTALDEYIAGQRFNAERPEAQVNLGGLYWARGQRAEAEAALLRAIENDATFAPAYVTLAEIRRSGGDEKAAAAELEQGLQRNPRSAELLHALGLSLVRQKRMPEALEKLTAAAKLDPGAPRFVYVAGVALHDAGKSDDALTMLRDGLTRNPNDRDILQALASYEVEARQFAAALTRAERLAELEPANPEAQRLLAAVRRMVR